MIAPLALDVLKAIAILMLVRIAVADFRTQKILNEHVLQLFIVGAAILLITFTTDRDTLSLGLAVAMAAALAVVLIIFWLLGKVGAGDVKLLATTPILLGYSASLPFVCVLLVFALVTYFVMKFPTILPERWFRGYVESLASTGRVPFGVPIAAAAIIVVLLPANFVGLATGPQMNASIQRACSTDFQALQRAAARSGFC